MRLFNQVTGIYYLGNKGLDMFSLFKKDPKKELQATYEKLMKEAVDAQRKGISINTVP